MMKLSDRALRELGLSPPFQSQFCERLAASATREEEASITQGSGTQPSLGEMFKPAVLAKAPRPIEKHAPLMARSAANLEEIARLDWNQLHPAIESCTACSLHQTRKNVVSGKGDAQARWLFVGEAPGAEEDQRGEPFVGAAGMLLNSMLAALNLSRNQDLYITNVMKCRPPDNRTPELGECLACVPFLERQIALIQPKIIVALGRVAAQTLLKSQINLGSLRNKVHLYEGIPLIVTFHPAYLLRNLPEKAKAWADLCLAKKTFDQA